MFKIHRMGCACHHDSSFVHDRPRGFDGYLMLFVKSKADFLIGGKTVRTEPDTFMIYDRGTPQHYSACEKEYVNDWMQFECSPSWAAGTGVRYDVPVFIGESIDVSQYFKLISDCYFRTDNMQTAGYLVKALLTEVFSENQGSGAGIAHYRELLDLRSRIYSAPEEDWSVTRMSALLNVSEPYLHTLYKRAFGVTCNRDVICSRIEQARHDLAFTEMTIEEVSFACGYSNTVHFSRQFKQITGKTPSQWRKEKTGREA